MNCNFAWHETFRVLHPVKLEVGLLRQVNLHVGQTPKGQSVPEISDRSCDTEETPFEAVQSILFAVHCLGMSIALNAIHCLECYSLQWYAGCT